MPDGKEEVLDSSHFHPTPPGTWKPLCWGSGRMLGIAGSSKVSGVRRMHRAESLVLFGGRGRG